MSCDVSRRFWALAAKSIEPSHFRFAFPFADGSRHARSSNTSCATPQGSEASSKVLWAQGA